MNNILCQQAENHDLHAVAQLAHDLWPDAEVNDLEKEFTDILQSSEQKIFVAKDTDNVIAFVHATLRHDYVEGSTTSPVGYLEGLYVKPEYRNQGIARKLVELSEIWARSLGCTEMGSDTSLDNTVSQQVHEKLGYEKSEVIVAYIKKL